MPHYGGGAAHLGRQHILLIKKEGLNTAHKNASTNEEKDFGV